MTTRNRCSRRQTILEFLYFGSATRSAASGFKPRLNEGMQREAPRPASASLDRNSKRASFRFKAPLHVGRGSRANALPSDPNSHRGRRETGRERIEFCVIGFQPVSGSEPGRDAGLGPECSTPRSGKRLFIATPWRRHLSPVRSASQIKGGVR